MKCLFSNPSTIIVICRNIAHDVQGLKLVPKNVFKLFDRKFERSVLFAANNTKKLLHILSIHRCNSCNYCIFIFYYISILYKTLATIHVFLFCDSCLLYHIDFCMFLLYFGSDILCCSTTQLKCSPSYKNNKSLYEFYTTVHIHYCIRACEYRVRVRVIETMYLNLVRDIYVHQWF